MKDIRNVAFRDDELPDRILVYEIPKCEICGLAAMAEVVTKDEKIMSLCSACLKVFGEKGTERYYIEKEKRK